MRVKLERIKPMLATLVDQPFNDKEWIYEIKWDGYRAIASIEHGKVDLYSRNFNSFNDNYSQIVTSLLKIKEKVILDGEIVAYDKEGNISFQILQNLGQNSSEVAYMVFDILFLKGKDLRNLPLMDRKLILNNILKKYKIKNIKISDYIEEKGKEFFKLAVEKDLEGIMAKKKDSIYISNRRTNYWLKLKHTKSDEAVIAGFTQGRGSRRYFGALVLGQYKGKEFVFTGHTGTGFNQKTLKELHSMMKPLITDVSPFKEKIPLNAPITWVKPKLVAQVKFAELTKGGNMRQPVYLGLREDKEAKNVSRENVLRKKL